MNTIKNLEKKTYFALFWNSIEAVFYQVILLVHQSVLFKVVTHSFYGMQGVFFATHYLAILFLNGAFEKSIAPFFYDLRHSKNEFKKFIIKIYYQFLFLFLSAGLIGYFSKLFSLNFFKYSSTTFFWIITSAFFIASEATKKNLRIMLQLAFCNKKTAQIELWAISFYIAFVWILYFFGVSFNLKSLIIPFVITSIITNGYLLHNLILYAESLPDTQEKIKRKVKINYLFLKTRFYLWINDIGKSFFSSNFLLPLLCYKNGIDQVGFAAFINTVTHSITFFIQKIFGPSGAALFANSKQCSTEIKKKLFFYLNKKCFQLIFYTFIIFGLFTTILFYLNIQKSIGHFLVIFYIFFFSHMLENLFILYEKYLITQEDTFYITLYNGVSFASCAFTLYFLQINTISYTVLTCISFRIAALAAFIKRLHFKNQ